MAICPFFCAIFPPFPRWATHFGLEARNAELHRGGPQDTARRPDFPGVPGVPWRPLASPVSLAIDYPRCGSGG